MWRFLRENAYTILFLALWLGVAKYAGGLLHVVLPLGVILLRRIDHWQDIFFGFIMCLVLSDSEGGLAGMAVMKSAKAAYILALAWALLVDRARMWPMAKIFGLFAPFFAYALLPMLRSDVPMDAFEKTLSYVLVYLVVPNYVLLNFRLYGWDFLRKLIWFLVFVLLSQKLLPIIWPDPGSFYREDRFVGWFGNPNGMAIFIYLTWVLFAVVNQLRRDLFTRWETVFIYGVLAYFLITCGARTSLMSTMMFILFIQFFRISIALGIISFLAFVGVGELVADNLPYIIEALGMEQYMRVDTIATGSGRYIAWNYAWTHIQEDGDLLIGSGFGHDYHVMYAAWRYLSQLGHQGGVHNAYLVFWMNVGIVGLLMYFRSFMLIFIKASKNTSIALAVMFSVLFSNIYESWLTASLNPYTPLLLVILTIMSEEEIIGSADREAPAGREEETGLGPPPLILPAR